MEIIPVVPRGYCQGVVRAIQIARRTAQEHPNEKIYMLGMIVHNSHVVDAFRELGIQCLEDPLKSRLQLLEEISSGIVIFTAHGVSDEVKSRALAKGLTIVDATCPDVAHTHTLVLSHCQAGGEVLYIGKRNHPEAEGVVSLNPHVHLITCPEDIDSLDSGLKNILITNQTTLSLLDTQELVARCLSKFPDAVSTPEICNATTIRQKAVMSLKGVDVLLVVGDPHSNNTNQLREIGLRSGIPHAYLIESAAQLQEDMVRGAERVAVTSGSSTPTGLTAQVIDFLNQYASDGRWQTPAPLAHLAI